MHEDLQAGIADLTETVANLPSLEAIRAELLTGPATSPEARDQALADLREALAGWFTAVDYGIESEGCDNARAVWVLNVRAAQRRYDRIVVHALAREVTSTDVDDLEQHRKELGADEGWLVAPRRVSPAARTRAAEAGVDCLSCYTLDELVDEEADFTSYLTWLQEEVRRRAIDSHFVQLACYKEEVDAADKAVCQRVWLRRGRRRGLHRSLGHRPQQGASVRARRVRHRQDVANPALRMAAGGAVPRGKTPWPTTPAPSARHPAAGLRQSCHIESLFSEFFFRKHEIQIPGYRAFEQLNRMGRLLLIFDGFDEMAARVDRQEMVNNFWELARVVTPVAKVLLTCRTEHFPEAREGRDLLGAKLRASTQALTGTPPQFEVVELRPMGPGQIEEMLTHITNRATVGIVLGNPALMDLMSRPVMSELVLDALLTSSAAPPWIWPASICTQCGGR